MRTSRVIAIVPIKHESTRVPQKNYKLMNNRPLYEYILETLTKSKYISDIYIDTNSQIIKEGVANKFPNIKIYDRPIHLWDGSTSTNKLLMNIIQDLDLKDCIFLQTHTTNPLLKTETIDVSINQFLASTHDSLFSVKELHTRLYDKNGQELNHDRFNLIPTQDLDPIFEENSCIYLFRREELFKYKSRIGGNPMMFVMDDIESQDIDYPNDFILTELLMNLHCFNNL